MNPVTGELSLTRERVAVYYFTFSIISGLHKTTAKPSNTLRPEGAYYLEHVCAQHQRLHRPHAWARAPGGGKGDPAQLLLVHIGQIAEIFWPGMLLSGLNNCHFDRNVRNTMDDRINAK
jgi:hypothetical protein